MSKSKSRSNFRPTPPRKAEEVHYMSLDWVIDVFRIKDKSKICHTFRDVVHRGLKAFPGLDSKQAKEIATVTGCPFYKGASDMVDLFLWVATFYDHERVSGVRDKAKARSSLEREIIVHKYKLNDEDEIGVFNFMMAAMVPQPNGDGNEGKETYAYMGREMSRKELRDAIRANATTTLSANESLTTLVSRSGEALPFMLELIRGARRILQRKMKQLGRKPHDRRGKQIGEKSMAASSSSPTGQLEKADLDKEAERQVMSVLHAELTHAPPPPPPSPPPASSETRARKHPKTMADVIGGTSAAVVVAVDVDAEVRLYISAKLAGLSEEERGSLTLSATALSTVRSTQPDFAEVKSGLAKEEKARAQGAQGAQGSEADGPPLTLRWSLYDRGIEYVREVRKLGAKCYFLDTKEKDAGEEEDDKIASKQKKRLEKLPAFRIVSFPRTADPKKWMCYDVVELFEYVRAFVSPSKITKDDDDDDDDDKLPPLSVPVTLRTLLIEAGVEARDVPFPNSETTERVVDPRQQQPQQQFMTDVDLNRLQIWYESFVTLRKMMVTMGPKELALIERISGQLVPSQIVDSESGWGFWIGRKLYNTLTYKSPDRPYLRAYGSRELVYGAVHSSEFVLSWLPYTIGVHALITLLEGLLCVVIKAFVISSVTPVGVTTVVGMELKSLMATYLKTAMVNFLREMWGRMASLAQSRYSGLLVAFVLGLVGRWLGFKPLIAVSEWIQRKADSKIFKAAAFTTAVVGVMVTVSLGVSTGGYLADGLLGGADTMGTMFTDRFMDSIHQMAASVPVIGPVYGFVSNGVGGGAMTWVGAEQAANLAIYISATFSQVMCRMFSFLGKNLEDKCTSAMNFVARHLGHTVIVSKVLRILWDVGYYLFTGGSRLLFTPCFRSTVIAHHHMNIVLDRLGGGGSAGVVDAVQHKLTVDRGVIQGTAKTGELRRSLGEVFKGYEGLALKYNLDTDVANYRGARVRELQDDLIRGGKGGVTNHAENALLTLETEERDLQAEDIKRHAKLAAGAKQKIIDQLENPARSKTHGGASEVATPPTSLSADKMKEYVNVHEQLRIKEEKSAANAKKQGGKHRKLFDEEMTKLEEFEKFVRELSSDSFDMEEGEQQVDGGELVLLSRGPGAFAVALQDLDLDVKASALSAIKDKGEVKRRILEAAFKRRNEHAKEAIRHRTEEQIVNIEAFKYEKMAEVRGVVIENAKRERDKTERTVDLIESVRDFMDPGKVQQRNSVKAEVARIEAKIAEVMGSLEVRSKATGGTWSQAQLDALRSSFSPFDKALVDMAKGTEGAMVMPASTEEGDMVAEIIRFASSQAERVQEMQDGALGQLGNVVQMSRVGNVGSLIARRVANEKQTSLVKKFAARTRDALRHTKAVNTIEGELRKMQDEHETAIRKLETAATLPAFTAACAHKGNSLQNLMDVMDLLVSGRLEAKKIPDFLDVESLQFIEQATPLSLIQDATSVGGVFMTFMGAIILLGRGTIGI